MKKYNALLLSSLIFVISLTGCEKDKDDQPLLPPVESLVMDFSAFNNSGDTITAKKTQANYYNWGIAYANVAVWNVFVAIKMAVPVAAYAEALKQTPVYLGDQRWEWKYSLSYQTINYSVRLYAARISNEEFKAEMFISRSGMGGYNNFKWFEGILRYDRTSAFWTIYDSPVSPEALITVEWNHNWETEAADITYTNVKTGDNEKDSFISYSITPTLIYDANYTISIKSGVTNIEWARETLQGRIKSPLRFGNGNWHCWNEYLQSMICQ